MTDSQSQISDSSSVHRILDASINRAGEGIRVVEDVVRMALQDLHLSQKLKQLRHDLTQAVSAISLTHRIAARDTVGDVGCTVQTETEYQRTSLSDSMEAMPDSGMVRANLSRTQQALRTIEEFSKLIDVDIAKRVEQIRYRSYTLEKAVLTTLISSQTFESSAVYVLINGCGIESGDSAALSNLVQNMIDEKVDLIQLRDKSLTDKQMVTAGRLIADATRDSQTRFIMNDRADLAVAANADGVHLGQDDIRVADARRIVGAAGIIGVSTHSIEQAQQAVIDGANYIGVGPVFPSQTKSFKSHVGVELIRQVAKDIKLPAFAIGGIHLENIETITDAGLNRVAVSGAIVRTNDPSAAVRKLKNKLIHVN